MKGQGKNQPAEHSKTVYHGGNFHGDYVSLEMDKLKIVTTKMSMLVERQINYLYNNKLNEKFDENNNIVGYIAGRKIPDRESMHAALAQYKEMVATE